MNQPIMDQPKPAIGKWLLIVLIIVILGAGAFWYFMMGPGKKVETATTTTPTTTTVKPSIYKNTDYNFQLTFSNDWKGYEVVKQPKGLDVVQASYKIWMPVPSVSYVQQSTDKKGFFNPLTIEVLTSAAWDDGNGGGVKNKGYDPSGIKPDLMGVSGDYTIVYQRNDEDLTGTTGTKFKDTLIPALVKTFSLITSSTPVSTDLTCTNDIYGFTYARPVAWGPCKVNEKTITGSTKTYYVEIATTDAAFAKEDDIQEAGYYSPFAISVYTLAQWETAQADESLADVLIIKNATYAFAWSQANGVPATDFGTKKDDIKTTLASFKLK